MKPTPSSPQQTKEMVDRLRRIETRLTKFMEWSGFDTDIQRPAWNNGNIELPSDAQSIRDCLAAIPEGWIGEVTLAVKGQLVAVIRRP